MTKQKNGKKIATIAMGAVALGFVGAQENASASTKIDDNHVQVEAGDTLSQIASDYDTTVDALVQNNNIADKDLIHVGDKLTITLPEKGNSNNDKNQDQLQSALTTDQNTFEGQHTKAQSSSLTTSSNSAKEWIAQRESGGSYTATNGRYIGKYQLDAKYLNGDYSPANQERVANEYAMARYGSWEAAQAFWQSHNWW